MNKIEIELYYREWQEAKERLLKEISMKEPVRRIVSCNLLTGANKSSYIDSFLDRSLNAGELSSGICRALKGDDEYSWFIR